MSRRKVTAAYERETVYFVREHHGSMVKVGRTGGDPKQRLSRLQTSSPRELRLVASVEDLPSGSEQRVHAMLQKHRHRGEWFELSPVQVKWYVAKINRRKARWHAEARAELKRFKKDNRRQLRRLRRGHDAF